MKRDEGREETRAREEPRKIARQLARSGDIGEGKWRTTRS